jgi:hypothetical protein
MRHYTVVFFFFCLLPGFAICGSNSVADRKAYWEHTIGDEVPLGTSEVSLISWARGGSLNIVTGSAPTTRVIGLE